VQPDLAVGVGQPGRPPDERDAVLHLLGIEEVERATGVAGAADVDGDVDVAAFHEVRVDADRRRTGRARGVLAVRRLGEQYRERPRRRRAGREIRRGRDVGAEHGAVGHAHRYVEPALDAERRRDGRPRVAGGGAGRDGLLQRVRRGPGAAGQRGRGGQPGGGEEGGGQRCGQRRTEAAGGHDDRLVERVLVCLLWTWTP
jgi:hypothetical protein